MDTDGGHKGSGYWGSTPQSPSPRLLSKARGWVLPAQHPPTAPKELSTVFCKQPRSTIPSPSTHPHKYVSVNAICSRIKQRQTQQLPSKYERYKTSGSSPLVAVGRGGSVPASTCTLQRASNSPSPRDADEARSRLGANNTGTKG